MECRISRSLLARLLAEAEAAHPNEICGLLVGSAGQIDEAVATANLARHPSTGFEIDPGQHLALSRDARRKGQAIVGCYHSHPRGPATPSESDKAQALQGDFYWLILGWAGARLWITERESGSMRFSPVALEVDSTALQPSAPEANRSPAWA